jgi:DNA-binding NarL/FixJ family response regulator
MTIRVLLVDDHELSRAGLHSLLEKETEIEIVGEAENGRMGIKQARKLKPDIVLMDIGMPDLNGIEATQAITSEVSGAKVIALSMYSNKHVVMRMLRAGASGYLLKSCAFEELVTALRTVVANHFYASPKITDAVVEDYILQLSQGEPAAGPLLTPREREILQLLVEGKSAKQIADHLSVSTNTVATHRSHIMSKLGTANLADLTKYALREGLIFLENGA